MLLKPSWILSFLIIKIFKDEGLLANVTYTKLLYCLGSMSESQQGPEICDVISAKCFLNAVNLPILSPGLTVFIRISAQPRTSAQLE